MGIWGPGRFLKAICRHGLVLVPTFTLVCAALLGLIGQPFGVPQLFMDDVNPLSVRTDVSLLFRLLSSATFCTQIYAVALLGLVWTLTVLLEQERDAREAGVKTLCATRTLLSTTGLATSLSALAPLASVLYVLAGRVGAGDVEGQVLILPLLGALAGFVLTMAATAASFAVSDWYHLRRLEGIVATSAVILLLLMYVPVILPAKAIFILLGWFVLAYTSFHLLPSHYRFPALVVLGLVAGLSNSVPEKYLFPGMEALYDSRIVLAPRDSARSEARLAGYAQGQAPGVCSAPGVPAGQDDGLSLLAPVAGLQAWHAHQVGQAGARKPKLVVVAASGGGYRATFWTALVLDALAKEAAPGRALDGFDGGIQLMTGASGGMVASAYFVARAAQAEAPDRACRLRS
jgi:hypothetical protein